MHLRPSLKALAVLASLLVAPGLAVLATEYHVDPETGSMANDGTATSPWSTLEAVFADGKTFEPGDRILLRDGYHGEPVVSGAPSDTVYIEAEEGHEPRLSRLRLPSGTRNWFVSGLRISRSYAPEFDTDTMVSLSGEHNTIDNCRIYSEEDSSEWTLQEWRDKQGRGISYGGNHTVIQYNTLLNMRFAISGSGTNAVIRGNTIMNFGEDAIRVLGDDTIIEENYIGEVYNLQDGAHRDGIQSWTSGPGGVGTGVVRGVIIRHNTIVAYTDPDRPMIGGLQGIGLFDGFFEEWVVKNNVVVTNHFHGITFLGARNCTIINNTVIDLDEDRAATWIEVGHHKRHSQVAEEDREQWASRGNIIRNNVATQFRIPDGSAVVENNAQVREHAHFHTWFADYPRDMRPVITGRRAEPLIDRGTGDGAPVTDHAGNPRPLDGTGDGMPSWDIGAYEYTGYGIWRRFTMTDEAMNVSTGRFLHGINVAADPWIWVWRLQNWAFIPPASPDTAGGWIWVLNQNGAPEGTPSSESWYGYPVDDGTRAETGAFLGTVDISHDPWIWIEDLSRWAYLEPAETMDPNGAWVWVLAEG